MTGDDAAQGGAGAPDATPATTPATTPDWAWMLPSQRPSPAAAVPRIAALCQAWPDPFMALFCVAATHQNLPREMVAGAALQFRPDLQDLGRDDVVALLIALVTGGRQGFDAVLRARRKTERKAAAALWVKD